MNQNDGAPGSFSDQIGGRPNQLRTTTHERAIQMDLAASLCRGRECQNRGKVRDQFSHNARNNFGVSDPTHVT
jgi:hypothetical protein